MKQLFSILTIFLGALSLHATHNRAGEITYKCVGGYTYEVIITTYTRDAVRADRCELELNWGDNTTSTLQRVNGRTGSCPAPATMGEYIGNDVRKNVYRGRHTYNAHGTYTLWFEDPNRNAGISNILQSVSVPFYIQSELVISPGFGCNNSPVLLNPPIDDGCLNERFEHNAGAYDSDGDSLSYRLVPSRGAGGVELPNIYNPQYVQDSIRIDPVTGDLIWDVPKSIGQFNFAFEISEWRQNKSTGLWVKIGYIIRDLQININNCAESNKPPVLAPVGPFCVEAGKTLNFNVSATDPDGDTVTLRAFGGVFQVENPADSTFGDTGPGMASDNFVWQTACNHVRRRPYYVTFEAKDDPSPRNPMLTRLVDLYTTTITVVAPAPQNPSAEAGDNAISLNWDPSPCSGAESYTIYRREGTYGFVPSQCETGVPEYTGYRPIDTIIGADNTSYVDSLELVRGVQYCYMVVANFPDDVESYASVEFCASLPLTRPMITNVDVLSTSPSTGEIDVKWIFPPELDSTLYPPPYSFSLLRADSIGGEDFEEILTQTTDTFYTDSDLNTLDQAYTYKVEMYYGADAQLLGEANPASSVYLVVEPTDQTNILRFRHNTPWRNSSYVIYKEMPTGSGTFDIIDTTYGQSFQDTGLVNGEEYCYKALSIGAFTANDSLPAPLLNHSQIACGVPIDTTPPCPPLVYGNYFCETDSLYLEWEYPTDSGCFNDVVEYRVYYKPTQEDEFPSDYISIPVSAGSYFVPDYSPAVGCYAVTAVDDASADPDGIPNESGFSEIFCAEPCPVIEFPNIFTPNGDNINEVFKPSSHKNIGQLQINIYNRWGGLVYKTSNVDDFLTNGWDGRDIMTGQLCSDGVYYYVCNFTPLSLSSTPVPQEVSGFVHLIASDN